MKSVVSVTIGAVFSLLHGVVSAAPVSIAGFTFDSANFPTATTFISGGSPSLSFASTGNVNSDLLKAVDSDLTSYIFGTPVTFNVAFGNAAIRNGAGADFVVFELGTPDSLSITLNGLTQTFLTVSTGFSSSGFTINAAAVDLSSFLLGAGASVGSFVINNASPTTGSASIAAIGALSVVPSAVPEPSTLILFCTAIVPFARRLRQGLRRPRLGD